MSAKAFDSDSDAAYPKSEGAYRTAGDVVPLKGTPLQTQSNYTINRAIGEKQAPTLTPANSNVIQFPLKAS